MGKIKNIDGLKGICAIAVFFSHLCAAFAPVEPTIQLYYNRMFFRWFDGNPAVDVFIILSTFLACRSFERQNLQDILIKKYLRIALPISVVLIAIGCLKYCGFFYNEQVGQMIGNDWLRGYPLDYFQLPLTLIISPFGKDYGWMNTLWMLKYIMISPIVILALKSITNHLTIFKKSLVILVIYLIFRNVDVYLINILYGFVLYEFNKQETSIRLKSIIGITSLILLFLMDLAPHKDLVLNVCRAICLVNLVLMSPMFAKVFSFKLFTWLGTHSMAIYLIHLPLIYSLSCYLWLKTGDIYLITIITTVALIILSVVYHKFVENPIYAKLNSMVNWIKS